MSWHLYVILTTDRKLYAGVTTEVQRRFREHLSQGRRAARYLRVEYWFKRLPRERKERVIRAGHLNFAVWHETDL